MENHYQMQKKPREKNEMLAFLGGHLILGVATAILFLLLLLAFDFGNIRTLVQKDHLEIVVYPLLLVFFSITFGSAAMGLGIMNLKKDDNDGGGKKVRFDQLLVVPILTKSKQRVIN